METGTKRVLMVDDERAFLRGISSWLRTQGNIDVLTAVNGAEAVSLLEQEPVDLVVTDLQMPVMDGFALLAHMSRHHPQTPVMVMTAYATGPALERMKELGSITCLEKPLIIEDFIAKVDELLSVQTRGYLQGISVASILQLLEMERKTAALTLSSEQGRGTMFFLEGRLIDAETESAEGDEAAMEIISWEQALIEIDATRKHPRKTVTSGLGFLIMESLRLKDEGRPRRGPPPPSEPDDEQQPGEAAGGGEALLDLGPLETPPPRPIEAQLQQIDGSLSPLLAIEGLEGVAVLDRSGNVLACRRPAGQEGFERRAKAFAAVARAAHETARAMGLEGCSEITMGTNKSLVLVQGPEFDGQLLFRVVAQIEWDCDQVVLATRLGELVPELIKILSN